MDYVIGFLSGLFFNWVAFWGLFVVAFLFESNECHWLAGIVSGLLVYIGFKMFGLTSDQMKVFALSYFPIGAAWSIWRYFRWVKDEAVKIKEEGERRGVELRYTNFEKLKASNNKSTIALWVLIWPVSFLENSLSDVFEATKALMQSMFGQVFDKIHRKVVASVYPGALK